MELAGHKEVTAATGLAVYSPTRAAPGSEARTRTPTGCFVSSCPRGVSMAGLTQDDLDQIAARLNTRPRKTLEFHTPADRVAALLR
jgi:IS30 family transposase